MDKYVPVLKWKLGERDALENLTDDVKDSLQPLFEIKPGKKVEKEFLSKLVKCWDNRKYYFYLCEEWFDDLEDDSERQDIFMNFYNMLVKNCAIPVFSLSEITYYENLLPSLEYGFCIRIQNNEFGLIEDTLNELVLKNNKIPKIDLLLDLGYIEENSLYEKQSLLKVAMMDVNEIDKYSRIIVSSCSFPKNTTSADIYTIYKSKRLEQNIHNAAQSISAKVGANYVYSDYALNDLSNIEFVVGMKPGYKIRYTIGEFYLFIKGKTLIKGGLDVEEVRKACRLLVSTRDFRGDSYSWGDQKISDLANEIIDSTGNLTNWVSYTYNHHMTLIVKEI